MIISAQQFLKDEDTGREFNLYDYGHSEFISLKKKGIKKYEGYHYGNSSYYEITVSGFDHSTV